MDDKDIKSIVITYEDGEQKQLDKGMVVSTKQDGEELHVNMAMCNMSGKEVVNYMESIIMAYAKMTGNHVDYEEEE